jgi:hypothetical protein
MLGLNPASLDAVRLEGIAGLPEVITRLDTTPPVIVPTVTPSPNVNGWNNSAVLVSWSVTDPESGISSSTGCTATSLTTDTSGTVLTCSATNAAGLPSTGSVTNKIDMTPPAITFAGRTPPNANGWNNSAVTLNWNCSDALSGVVSSTVSVALTAGGMNQSATGTCQDKAGNQSSNTQSGINIDLVPPALVLPASVVANATSLSGAGVSFVVTASDALDPSPVVICSPSSGSTFPIGNTSVACTATDRAGNKSSGSFVVTVKGVAAQVSDLLTLVSSFNLTTLGNSLTAKLQNIQSKLDNGQTNAVCGQLGAFIGEVSGQSGKGLTVAQANELIGAANQILALVGCSNQ